jgi:hypothetical protein
MLNTHIHLKNDPIDDDAAFRARVNLIRTSVIVAFGLFVGAVLGGVCGLFVYANSRNPGPHDPLYAIIQSVGIIVGLVMGYLAARNAQVQDDMLESSQRAGTTLLRRYKPKPGAAGQSNVGQRTIGATTADDFLKTLLAK